MNSANNRPRRKYNCKGIPGLVSRVKCETTRTVISLYRVDQMIVPPDTKDSWLIKCEDHGTMMSCRTAHDVSRYKGHPAGWCIGCAKQMGEPLPEDIPTLPSNANPKPPKISEDSLENSKLSP